MTIEVSYNCQSDYGVSWSSGSRRFGSYEELGRWLHAQTEAGKPTLVTEVRDLTIRR